MTSFCIEDADLATAWGRALILATKPTLRELVPLVVSITGFDQAGVVQEDMTIRGHLDKLLRQLGKQSVHTVANTIFPLSLWNPTKPRSFLYSRYQAMLPQLQSATAKNRHGLYFQRMLTGGPPSSPNQLEFALSNYTSRRGVRRSVLQIGIFQPAVDHSTAAMRGFPCLQHITLSPVGRELSVNAFYATQYLVERAYGNYLGLCRLGRFAAHELGLRLKRVTCVTGIAEVDARKSQITNLCSVVSAVIRKSQTRETR